MGRFILDCDVLNSKVDEFNSLAGQMQDLGSYISSFPSNTSEFNFAKAINCISANLDACAKKVNNTGVYIKNVIDSHTNLQNSLVFERNKYRKDVSNNKTVPVSNNGQVKKTSSASSSNYSSSSSNNSNVTPSSVSTARYIGSATASMSDIVTASTSNANTVKATATRINVDGVKGSVINIPAGLGKIHTYMGWQMITAPSSQQYKLREEAGMNFDEEGFGIIGDRYVIACTTTFGNVGDCVDFVQEDGSVIKCVIGDIKSQEYVPWDHNPANQWGHNNGQCIVEFVVDKNSWYNCGHPNPGNRGCHPEWHQNITQAINYGNYKNYLSKQV